MQLRQPEAYDWAAAAAAPAVVALLIATNLFNVRTTAMRTSPVTNTREATNVAAMATRDYYTATQDKNPLMALVHVTSAAAYLAAARRLSSDEELSLGLNTDVRAVASDIDELQRRITARLGKARRIAGSLPT